MVVIMVVATARPTRAARLAAESVRVGASIVVIGG
jgi:hypothetical protein